MTISARRYAPADAEAFLALNRACLRHYDIAAATSDQEARLIALLDSGRHLTCELAFDDGHPAGFAMWTLTFPAEAGIALFMKELFVDPTTQGRGIGKALLGRLCQIAKAEGCKRFDWQTDGNNAKAQAFYGALGVPMIDKISYRVADMELDSFAERLMT